MSRLNQLSRLQRAMRPRAHLSVQVPEGRVAPKRLELSALSYGLRGRLGVGGDGELVALDEEAQGLLFRLSDELRSLVGSEVVHAVEERSRYTWEAFVGHCLRWWFGAGAQLPILRALQLRLADHAIELEVAWAEGVSAGLSPSPASQLPMWIGGAAGLALSQEFWWAPWPIAVALGLLIGKLSARARWRCTSFGCGELMERRLSRCSSCGATLREPSAPRVEGSTGEGRSDQAEGEG